MYCFLAIWFAENDKGFFAFLNMDSGPTMSPTNDVVESIQEIKTFHPADYAVFCCLFVVSAVIGLFFAIKDRKKKNSETYLLAGR